MQTIGVICYSIFNVLLIFLFMNKLLFLIIYLILTAYMFIDISQKKTISEGKYYGHLPQYAIFVNIQKDVVIADWFLIDKFPREHFSDTLLLNIKDYNKWEGCLSSIVKENNKLYFESTFYCYLQRKRVRIRLNEKYYNTYCDLYKSIFKKRHNADY